MFFALFVEDFDPYTYCLLDIIVSKSSYSFYSTLEHTDSEFHKQLLSNLVAGKFAMTAIRIPIKRLYENVSCCSS